MTPSHTTNARTFKADLGKMAELVSADEAFVALMHQVHDCSAHNRLVVAARVPQNVARRRYKLA